MSEIDKIRKRINKKLGNFYSKVEGGGTFSMHAVLDEVEMAVYNQDYQKQVNLLNARLCPNCTVSGNDYTKLVRKKKGIFDKGILECPKCGFGLAGV